MSYGRAMVWGAAAALLVVALAVAGVVATGANGSALSTPGDRVVVVLASHDASGTQVAQVVGVLDASHGDPTLELVDPDATVAVPGTSFDHLRDAYPFGGGAAVSNAYASLAGVKSLPAVTLTEPGLVALVRQTGPLTVGIPTDLNAFDGARLFSFEQGQQQLSGEDVAGLLVAAGALPPADAQQVRANVAKSLANAIGSSDVPLRDLVASGGITSSLKEKDLLAFIAKVQPGLGRLTLTTAVR